jgi:hypothetical protein
VDRVAAGKCRQGRAALGTEETFVTLCFFHGCLVHLAVGWRGDSLLSGGQGLGYLKVLGGWMEHPPLR